MDIEDIRRKRTDLEFEIRSQIIMFEKETGVRVEGIGVTHEYDPGSQKWDVEYVSAHIRI